MGEQVKLFNILKIIIINLIKFQTCAICLDDLFNEEELAYMENCEHIYHADCFKEHLKVVIKSRDNAKIICPGDGCKSQVIVDAYQNLLSDQEY